ncbi:MAG TPA: GNAT family N-acetyltransferase [Candidatus Saccharimonadales bacterium]
MKTDQATEQFTITPATKADVLGIGQAHLQATREAYPNKDLGIDVAWINKQYGFLVADKGNKFRQGTVRQSQVPNGNVLYLVVKNKQGKICGFLHVERRKEDAYLAAIYLIEEARGSGVAQTLMDRALTFAGDLPMTLSVADYNQRAISFYEKYGFEKVPNSRKILKEKLPIIDMQRPLTGKVQI